jgi:hypothetical protein
MNKKEYPKVKKRFVLGMVPALITLALVTIAVCIAYTLMH